MLLSFKKIRKKEKKRSNVKIILKLFVKKKKKKVSLFRTQYDLKLMKFTVC